MRDNYELMFVVFKEDTRMTEIHSSTRFFGKDDNGEVPNDRSRLYYMGQKLDPGLKIQFLLKVREIAILHGKEDITREKDIHKILTDFEQKFFSNSHGCK